MRRSVNSEFLINSGLNSSQRNIDHDIVTTMIKLSIVIFLAIFIGIQGNTHEIQLFKKCFYKEKTEIKFPAQIVLKMFSNYRI